MANKTPKFLIAALLLLPLLGVGATIIRFRGATDATKYEALQKFAKLSKTGRRYEEKHPNGVTSVVGVYEGDNRAGTWLHWDDKGVLISAETYRDKGTRRLLTEFYSNGQKKKSGEFLNGAASGVWRFWDESGKEIENAKNP